MEVVKKYKKTNETKRSSRKMHDNTAGESGNDLIEKISFGERETGR